MLHVSDLSQWEACEVSWGSPLKVMALTGSSAVVAGPLARRSHAPEPLLSFAARHGFLDLSMSVLGNLCRVIGCEIDNSEKMPQRLRRMIKHVLGSSVPRTRDKLQSMLGVSAMCVLGVLCF